ncbi:MAG TPA: IS200/IS605 family transposase [Prolixibacteraceae bacterium]
MSFVKVMIHAVWGTKNKEHLIHNGLRARLLEHIVANAKTKDIFIDTINSQSDHVHCLFGLNADMALSKALNLIKGESSFWINKQKITNYHFEWAVDYFAASVSESQVSKVRTYIQNQDEHHRKVTFLEEYNKFMESYGFNIQG